MNGYSAAKKKSTRFLGGAVWVEYLSKMGGGMKFLDQNVHFLVNLGKF